MHGTWRQGTHCHYQGMQCSDACPCQTTHWARMGLGLTDRSHQDPLNVCEKHQGVPSFWLHELAMHRTCRQGMWCFLDACSTETHWMAWVNKTHQKALISIISFPLSAGVSAPESSFRNSGGNFNSNPWNRILREISQFDCIENYAISQPRH